VGRYCDPASGHWEGHNLRITQRHVAIGMQIMVLIGLVGIAIFQVIAGNPPVAIIANIWGWCSLPHCWVPTCTAGAMPRRRSCF